MTKEIITKKCKQCNNQVKKGREHCSTECYRKTEKLKQSKPNAICDNCEKPFKQDKSKLKVNKNNFCCMDCYQSFHRVKRIIVKCKGCGEDLELSTNSALKYKNRKQINFYCRDSCRRKKQVSTCVNCGVMFSGISFRSNGNVINKVRRTCSDKCLRLFYKNNKERKEKISIAFSGPKHPNYVNGYSKNYRIRKTDLKENFSNRDKREVYKLFNNQCFKCGAKEDLTVDHNLPFCKGGRLTKSNCVILCRSCNSKKNAKSPTKFYTVQELKKLKALGVDHDNLFNFIF